jgi:hypothetical protein
MICASNTIPQTCLACTENQFVIINKERADIKTINESINEMQKVPVD